MPYNHGGSMIKLSVMKLRWIVVTFSLMVVLHSCSYAEAGALPLNNKDIKKADRLGEDFQQQGPWSRQEPLGGGFYGIPQPEEYQATPESQIPNDEPGSGITQYPLCYNPYSGSYEYCYPRESFYFRSRFSSPDFRIWWKRGRACPPGYYFVPKQGCYRN
jgi:hypothetical protein